MQSIEDSLPENRAASDFMIRYALRNPIDGDGLGADGVRYEGIVDECQKAFEWLGREFKRLGFARPRAPFPVYLYERKVPTTVWDGTFRCLLPSRTAKVSIQAERQYFRSTAIHEGTHCYCWHQKGFSPPGSLPDPWRWISEATSTWMEFRLVHQNPGLRSRQALEYWRDWCDYPERPLLKDSGMYQSGAFLHYIDRRWGERVVASIWTRRLFDPEGRRSDGDPFDVLRGLTGEMALMGDYALHAYFFSDPASACYAPGAAKRYLSRALTKSVVFRLYDPDPEPISGEIKETGIRYYAVRLVGRNSLSVAFCVNQNATKESKCTAKLVAAGPNLRRIGNPIDLSDSPSLVEAPPGTDHLVIVVTVEPRVNYLADSAGRVQKVRVRDIPLESHAYELFIAGAPRCLESV